ncbi:N-acetylmuramoyl-L-alanine amidase [Luteolibacter sp. GHJ8]|uniref:N-acetylmuramoyl-L-alanine amidase n=1 Tax=Luteolibacter rhizosphaerae TaxID=2989719 RepID=A0ABT3G3F7_9BACT|nr:N-acetylmuramoyl-L-alanine amidase [Luteolibacter rhizosphaerae]MCW1914370.1 N-acetylmuramoyl-L-alanine amidase [Luteolibacter rhizosphaerae]
MKSRALPFLIPIVLGAAVMLLVLRKAPPGPTPEDPGRTAGKATLSDLAGSPDWLEINRYQSTISRRNFLRLMDDVFTVSPAWRDYFKVGDQAVEIQTAPGESFQLRFAPEGIESPAPRYWRSCLELPAAPADQPLAGLKIAIDPGHIGGDWAKMEERWFQIPGSPPVQEGDMTLQVAKLMKPKLEAMGAIVTLVRDKTEPVTPLRPEMLREEAGKSSAGGDIVRLSERLFYRTAEIRARAKLVNETIQPDLVLCLHFNADAWGNPAAPTLVPKNHFHMILNGAYTDDEVGLADQRHDLLLKLLQGIHTEEANLAQATATAFVERTAMPPYIYFGGVGTAKNVQGNPYLWARNLLANRIYHCPVLYYEPYVMNSQEDHARMIAGDYEGLREVAGKNRPSIFREYADAAVLGLQRYYTSNRAVER